ncbi:plasmid maintenance system killer protein [bacterium BMS3Abin13]|nr:plasmid maintenance system killer protein [bacterium BMS3Abin13]
MIKSFLHKGVERFYRTGNKSGIQARHAAKLRRILIRLEVAAAPMDMDLPGFRLHPLHGNRRSVWSVTVQANWRVTFRFNGQDVEIVNYEDYH